MFNRIGATCFIFCMMTIVACSGTKDIIPHAISSKIPNGAQKVILTSDLPADSLYKMVYMTLVKEGLGIVHSNDRMHTITTGSFDFEVTLKVNAVIISNRTGSKAIINGFYPIGPSWNNAFWSTGFAAGDTDPQIAFAEMVRIANEMPHKSINYSR